MYEFVTSFLNKADKQNDRAAAIMRLGAVEDFIRHFPISGYTHTHTHTLTVTLKVIDNWLFPQLFCVSIFLTGISLESLQWLILLRPKCCYSIGTYTHTHTHTHTHTYICKHTEPVLSITNSLRCLSCSDFQGNIILAETDGDDWLHPRIHP